MRGLFIFLLAAALGLPALAEEPGRVQLSGRIAILLAEVASQASHLDDADLRLSCQLDAAEMLWPDDRDAARRIYEDAFEWVTLPRPGREAESARLVGDLLAATARHDPPLAERFVARLAILDQRPTPDRSPADRTDALVNAGIEMLPGDPARAGELARLALVPGLTPSAMRLLIVLRSVDAPRADAIFSEALERSLQSPGPSFAEIAAASSYYLAAGGAAPSGVPPGLTRIFLVHAAQWIHLAPPDTPEATAAYFFGRQLAALFQTHLPERSAEVAARVALLSQTGLLARPAPRPPDADGGDADRGSNREATAMQLVRAGRFGDAEREIRRHSDAATRASLFVALSNAARARKDPARAIEALVDAEREARRIASPAKRASLLFDAAAAYADLDIVLAFSVLGPAVDARNGAVRTADAKTTTTRSSFAGVFARLARADFDGALLAARRLDSRADRLVAELAVCRGGLAREDED